jgi:hypothetical protein
MGKAQAGRGREVMNERVSLLNLWQMSFIALYFVVIIFVLHITIAYVSD